MRVLTLPSEDNKITGENWWFRLCGLNDLDERIGCETNGILNFSNDELRFIATELLSMDNPRVIQTTNTENQAEQIRKGADGLISIIGDNKNRIAKLEQNISKKQEILTEIKMRNIELSNDLRHSLSMIKQLKNESGNREKRIRSVDAIKFKLIIK